MLGAGQPMGDLRDSWARECTTRVIDASASASPRIAIASAALVAWAAALYATSVPWSTAGEPPGALGGACMVLAGAYPCAAVLMGMARSWARRRWAKGGLRDFLAAQRAADEAYTVAWDLMGVAARTLLVVGLALHRGR